MVQNIFKTVKYTELKDTTSVRTAKLHILGMPLYSWTQETLKVLANSWGELIDCFPTSPISADFYNPYILVETTHSGQISKHYKL